MYLVLIITDHSGNNREQLSKVISIVVAQPQPTSEKKMHLRKQ